MPTSKTRTIVVAASAALAVILVGVSLWMQYGRASTLMPNSFEIDFTAYPKTDPILVSKGEKVDIPIMVESSSDADYDIVLSVVPERPSFGSSDDNVGLTVDLTTTSVTLSPKDNVSPLGPDRVERDTRALVSVSASSDSVEGTYHYILEATKYSNGEGVGAGKLFTVTVN